MYLTVRLVKLLVVSSWRIHWLYTHYYLTTLSITQKLNQPTRYQFYHTTLKPQPYFNQVSTIFQRCLNV